ncbi:ThuA domain-containing protein [Flavobacteriaceae bacterium F89]|uniref:ThuA domain-containing protein n=1 Tax=Cerina litoralis TaxID=2874477 RepID=A0AAE3EYM4_9FLAO|nr:ThuA domain-containing protein [Cerina litoralis]MCG2462161.1 ThuA domain-containing protein [Cerina litoralis]
MKSISTCIKQYGDRPQSMASIVKFLLAVLLLSFAIACSKKEKRILVFSKTEGYRHASIGPGIQALKKLGAENGFKVTATEDTGYIKEDSLRQYAAVLFLSTSGNILNDVQQADLERYIQAGGGFVGIHEAVTAESDWPWYHKLVGARFDGHPKVQEATLKVIDRDHPSTSFMDRTWVKTDEWYNFKDFDPGIEVVIAIDENSYEGGKNGTYHPISWYHDFDGGRSFYTAIGHSEETYDNAKFLTHVLGGIQYAMGDNELNYQQAKTDRVPPEDRFAKTVLDFNLNEPMELDELPGKGILFVERRGLLRLYDFKTKKTENLAQLNLFYGNEDGLLGLAVDPDYKNNHWIYLFYSVAGKESKQHISRFNLEDNKLDLASEKVLLTIPTDRHCCHSGGALEFGPDGNLFITVGDNTNPFESSGFAPIDEREGRKGWDAQRSAGNTNDLRGNILRIKPEDDGTYSIPKGNLFPEGTPKTRPEIYVKGCRNPFRASVDSKTGYLYWGDVGPDAGKADPQRGPSGMGEYDQARKAGYWGWPYTRGYNEPYNDFDFVAGKSGEKFNPDHLINDSPNNSGMQRLPPAQKSMIPMTYYRSEEFPWMGEGGINPMAGPVFHASDQPNAHQQFPAYFENKLFLYEWMRDWIYVITLDDDYNYVKADAFMPNTEFSHPMDMIFGSDGNLYVLEYGQKWNSQNLDARLSRISYISGNRKPLAKITQDKSVGSIPLTVQFSASGSKDFDGDVLDYQWFFTKEEVQSNDIAPTYTFTDPGNYTVRLHVTDAQGETTSTSSKILVGNDAPQLSIQIEPSDTLYWDGKEVNYKVVVSDKQDGSTTDGTIGASNVKVTFNFVPEGKDMVQATVGHQRNTVPEGKQVIDGTDCKACHAVSEKVNGPSYTEIAKKYTENDKGYLIAKIIKGGAGVWGESPMSAHPQLKMEDVSKIVDYILSLKPNNATARSLPLEGTISFGEHLKGKKEGSYVLMASYSDDGITGQEGSELVTSEQIIFKKQKTNDN